MRAAFVILIGLALTACSGGRYDDLQQFVAESGKNLRNKVEPLPLVKPYEPFAYNPTDLPDPFKPRALRPTKGGGGPQPDLNRPKEALEAYPLDSLKMVGTLQQKGITYGLIKTPDNNVYRAKIGNYMGQNFGIITGISESEIKLTETIQDSTGGWSEQNTSISLTEEAARK